MTVNVMAMKIIVIDMIKAKNDPYQYVEIPDGGREMLLANNSITRRLANIGVIKKQTNGHRQAVWLRGVHHEKFCEVVDNMWEKYGPIV